jgi:hypothetical protein
VAIKESETKSYNDEYDSNVNDNNDIHNANDDDKDEERRKT